MEQMSLWGDEFASKEVAVKKILKKIKEPKAVKEMTVEQLLNSKKVAVERKMEIIESEVNRILGKFKENTVVIEDYDSFTNYIDACIQNGIMSIDTETNNSLNTFDCKLMGLCLYTPGQKNVYIPVNHTTMEGVRLSWQLTELCIKEQLKRCADLFKVFHNAVFDIEVIKQTCGIKLYADWDTQVGAVLLNENEQKGLKAQYKLHIDSEQEKYSIEHLFGKLPYAIFDPKLFALYAATDAYETYRLYEYQRAEFKKPGMEEVYKLFQEIEIPILDVVVDMELEGVEIDTEYAKKLSVVYHEKADAMQVKIDEELAKLKPQIDAWRQTPEANKQTTNENGKVGKSLNQKLADPPKMSSPEQVKILLYDVLKAPIVSQDGKKTTGKDVLKELSDIYPICAYLAEKKGYDKLLESFIDNLPALLQKDGRVHARFNSTGTKTGRFSSDNPNLQNIPSKAKDVRMMFKAPAGYSIVGGDFGAQEPRSTACLSNDTAMIDAYKHGKDLYAVIGSKCYHNDYWSNLEFDKEGKLQPEGKKRRARAKTVLLGVTYGMGSGTLAMKMNLSRDEAETIIDDFYLGFPGVAKLTKDSQEMLKRVGYVTDMFGRRRHIPDAQLPEYDITPLKANYDFNPLLGTPKHIDVKAEALISQYRTRLERARWKKDKDVIIAQAARDGLKIKNNGGFISRALRQCLNARIQGTAASMTKLAMIMIHNDKELNDLGFKLLVTVHDEVFGMAPTENSDRAAKRLAEVMIDAANVKCNAVPWKVDCYEVSRWYLDEFAAEVLKDYNKLNNLDAVKAKYPAIKPDYIEQMCNETLDCNKYVEL